MTCALTPSVLQGWLEWAGARLIAMPGRREGPAPYRVIWPDFSQNKFELLEFRGRLPLRAAAPDKDEIDIVDEILLFPNVCKEIPVRRILQVRSLVHPLNGRHLYPWTRIAKLIHTDRKTVKRWHARGLHEVVTKADNDKVCSISRFFTNRAA